MPLSFAEISAAIPAIFQPDTTAGRKKKLPAIRRYSPRHRNEKGAHCVADETKIQWHPAFCSAIELTLLKNAGSLNYIREFNLSSKPLQIDLLVINKDDDVQIEDEIGRIFRRHNLLEYKSSGDAMNIDTWYKAIGYGCLYKALAGNFVNEIRADTVTLTLVRREKPKELLKALISGGLAVSSNYPGIYRVRGNVLFETQIIVSEELPSGSHVWLKALTRRIEKKEAQQLLINAGGFRQGSRERELADSVLQVAMSANYDMFDDLKKEDPIMCDALKKLMKPELDAAVDAAIDNKARDVAERMIRAGKLTDQDIADYTGLTLSQVRSLREEMKAVSMA